MKSNMETKKDIDLGNAKIRIENNRLRSITINGVFDYLVVKKAITDLPDNNWINLAVDKKIYESRFHLSDKNKNIHDKIKELVKELNIVIELNITEKNEIGYAKIETVGHKGYLLPERIQIKYVNDYIEKLELANIGTDETKKALMKVLNIPDLDKLTPSFVSLSFRGEIPKSIDQKLLDFINTLNRPCKLIYQNGTYAIHLEILRDKFLYFNNKIYPFLIFMDETYPQIVKFLPMEIRKVLDKFSGFKTIIDIRVSTKEKYEKTLYKALAFLSKLNPPVPLYLRFDENWFLTPNLTIIGSYEKLDGDINFLFKAEALVLKPLRIIVFDSRHKILIIEKPGKSDDLTKPILETLKKFLGVEVSVVNFEESQNTENNKILYYLFKHGNYYIITNKELLPTVLHNLPKFIRWKQPN